MSASYVIEAVFIAEDRSYQISEIVQIVGIGEHQFLELVECELIAVVRDGTDRFRFIDDGYAKTRRAARIARDFDLAPSGLALAVRLLERIDQLERGMAQHTTF